MNGKGSAPRPFSVDNETFKRNFDAIFGKTNEDFNQNSSSSERSVAKQGGKARTISAESTTEAKEIHQAELDR